MNKLIYKLKGKKWYTYETIFHYRNFENYIGDFNNNLIFQINEIPLEYEMCEYRNETYDHICDNNTMSYIVYNNIAQFIKSYNKPYILKKSKLIKHKTIDTLYLKSKDNKIAYRIPFTSVYITEDLKCYTFKPFLENNSFNQVLKIPNSININFNLKLFKIPEQLLYIKNNKFINILLNGKYNLDLLYLIAKNRINFEYLISNTSEFNKHLKDIISLYQGLKYIDNQFILENNTFGKYNISMGIFNHDNININCIYFKIKKISNTSFEIETFYKSLEGESITTINLLIDFKDILFKENKTLSDTSEIILKILIKIGIRALVHGYKPGYTYENLFTNEIPTNLEYITWSEQ